MCFSEALFRTHIAFGGIGLHAVKVQHQRNYFQQCCLDIGNVNLFAWCHD